GSEYLNWRFFDTPLYDTERIEIKKHGKLAGYIVYTLQKGVATFRDMVCIDNGTAEALLSHWVRLLKRGSVRSASVILMDQNPLVAMLKSIGFMIRPETSQVYAYAGADKGFSKEWITGQNWYMTVGDRDV
ncbi:MAG: hypothetical protein ACE5FU_04840, partial [Nitrospinota bacterium]